MSWRHAPLYVRAHDLARWHLAHFRDAASYRELVAAASAAMVELLCSLALALTFPASRDRHREQADEALVRVRTLGSLACELSLMSPRQLRYMSGELVVLGRMLGGWRRASRNTARRLTSNPGAKAQAAPPASCAAAHTGTTPTGAVPRTGTGTTHRTGGTTPVSASPCPPPP